MTSTKRFVLANFAHGNAAAAPAINTGEQHSAATCRRNQDHAGSAA